MRKQTVINPLLLLSDGMTLSLAWVISYYLRFHSGIEAPSGIPEPLLYFKLIPFILMFWLSSFAWARHYNNQDIAEPLLPEILSIYKTSFLATLLFIAFTYFYEEYRYSRITLSIFFLIHPLLITAGRRTCYQIFMMYYQNIPQRNVLVIGSGDFLRHSLSKFNQDAFKNLKYTGAILLGHSEKNKAYCDEHHIQVHDPVKDWHQFFKQHQYHRVLFCLSLEHSFFLEKNLSQIANLIPDIKIIPDLTRFTRLTAGVQLMRGLPIIDLHDSPLSGTGWILKRSMDIIGSLLGIILSFPIFVMIILAIRLTSKGPIYYKQTRMGLDGQAFHCLKFRTMKENAEEKTGAVFAQPDDHRTTMIGRYLRKTSLDELPQLLNVLRGEMSLVGPRPERPFFVDQFRLQIPGYMLRHKVKTGITGWAQVNGWRGNTSIAKRIECDLYYIQNWSAWLDIKILLLTIEEVFRGKNAY